METKKENKFSDYLFNIKALNICHEFTNYKDKEKEKRMTLQHIRIEDEWREDDKGNKSLHRLYIASDGRALALVDTICEVNDYNKQIEGGLCVKIEDNINRSKRVHPMCRATVCDKTSIVFKYDMSGKEKKTVCDILDEETYGNFPKWREVVPSGKMIKQDFYAHFSMPQLMRVAKAMGRDGADTCLPTPFVCTEGCKSVNTPHVFIDDNIKDEERDIVSAKYVVMPMRIN